MSPPVSIPGEDRGRHCCDTDWHGTFVMRASHGGGDRASDGTGKGTASTPAAGRSGSELFGWRSELRVFGERKERGKGERV